MSVDQEQPKTITVNVRTQRESLKVKILENATVKQLKLKISEKLLQSEDQFRLIFAGKMLLNDEETLKDIKLEDGYTVHLIMRLSGAASGGGDSASASTSTSASSSPARSESQVGPSHRRRNSHGNSGPSNNHGGTRRNPAAPSTSNNDNGQDLNVYLLQNGQHGPILATTSANTTSSRMPAAAPVQAVHPSGNFPEIRERLRRMGDIINSPLFRNRPRVHSETALITQRLADSIRNRILPLLDNATPGDRNIDEAIIQEMEGVIHDLRELNRTLVTFSDQVNQMINQFTAIRNMRTPLQNMLSTNPDLQNLVENNPALLHAINNRHIQRQMELVRNPATFQEYLRTQDRALSNIESLPGGSSVLEQVYRDVQQPLMEAVQDQFYNLNLAQYPNNFAAGSPSVVENQQGSINLQPLPNPWSTSPIPIPGYSSFPTAGPPPSFISYPGYSLFSITPNFGSNSKPSGPGPNPVFSSFGFAPGGSGLNPQSNSGFSNFQTPNYGPNSQPNSGLNSNTGQNPAGLSFYTYPTNSGQNTGPNPEPNPDFPFYTFPPNCGQNTRSNSGYSSSSRFAPISRPNSVPNSESNPGFSFSNSSSRPDSPGLNTGFSSLAPSSRPNSVPTPVPNPTFPYYTFPPNQRSNSRPNTEQPNAGFSSSSAPRSNQNDNQNSTNSQDSSNNLNPNATIRPSTTPSPIRRPEVSNFNPRNTSTPNPRPRSRGRPFFPSQPDITESPSSSSQSLSNLNAGSRSHGGPIINPEVMNRIIAQNQNLPNLPTTFDYNGIPNFPPNIPNFTSTPLSPRVSSAALLSNVNFGSNFPISTSTARNPSAFGEINGVLIAGNFDSNPESDGNGDGDAGQSAEVEVTITLDQEDGQRFLQNFMDGSNIVQFTTNNSRPSSAPVPGQQGSGSTRPSALLQSQSQSQTQSQFRSYSDKTWENPNQRQGQSQARGYSTLPLEVHYRDQLVELENMGFLDKKKNLEALAATLGDMSAAVERLLRYQSLP